MEPAKGIGEPPAFITDDLSFAAYLRLHGLKEISANRLGKMFKIVFVRVPLIRELRKKWVESESYKFDREVRYLKKSLYTPQPVEEFSEYHKESTQPLI